MADDDDDDEKPDLGTTSFAPVAWHGKTMEQLLSAPRGMPVSNSTELTRVLNLPRRPTVHKDTPTAQALVMMQMAKYSRGPRVCRCGEIDKRIARGDRQCIRTFKWEQAWALHEMSVTGGVLISAPVGCGKTLLNILSASALKVNLALLLIPSTLRQQIIIDYQLIAEHSHVPTFVVHLPGKKTWRSAVQRNLDGTLAPTVHVIPYTFLSGTENSQWIENLRPDAIICDEVDALADMESARTMRVMRYFDQYHATTKFCGWTGSMTDNSVKEFAHLAALALRTRSPLPLEREVIDEWSRCLDAVPNPCPPGALTRLLNPGEANNQIRRAFRRRLAESPGVIMIEGRQVIVNAAGREVKMDIREKDAPPIPTIVAEALARARDFLRPDTLAPDAPDEATDEILVDPLEQARVVRQVATGMFYRWKYPRGEPRELVLEWLAARKAWHGELRYKMLRGEAQLDSEALCRAAAQRAWGDIPPDVNLPYWKADHWPKWRDIADRVKPETEAVRLHPYLVEDAAEWGTSNRGILWYGMVEFATWLGELTGLKVYGMGSEKAIADVKGDRSCIASIKSHGRGRDGLQFAFDNQLVINTLASARMYQQLLGRLHRQGQKSDTVNTEIYLHTPELRSTLDQAFRRGEYVEGTTGEEQKLIEGWTGDVDFDADE